MHNASSSGPEPIYIKLGEKCVKCQQNSLKQVNQGFNTNFDKNKINTESTYLELQNVI